MATAVSSSLENVFRLNLTTNLLTRIMLQRAKQIRARIRSKGTRPERCGVISSAEDYQAVIHRC